MPAAQETVKRESESGEENEEHEPQEPSFTPVVALPEVEVSNNEENEEEIIKLRAKLFRFDNSDPEQPEWKERGTGEVKLLRHKQNNSIRIVMRRDKTLKICANHFITPWMELKPSCGSNRAFVWRVWADFADEKAKSECLAIRFATADIAAQWKNKFEEAQEIMKEKCELYKNNASSTDLNVSSETESDESVSKESSSPEKQENNSSDHQQESQLTEQIQHLSVSN